MFVLANWEPHFFFEAPHFFRAGFFFREKESCCFYFCKEVLCGRIHVELANDKTHIKANPWAIAVYLSLYCGDCSYDFHIHQDSEEC